MLYFLILFSLCGFGSFAQTTHLSQLSYDELDSLMYIEYDKGDYRNCIPYSQAGREKARKEFGNQDTLYALYTNDLASFYTEMGEYKSAEPLFKESKAIYEKVYGKEAPEYANSLNNLSLLYEYQGKFLEAEPLILETIDIRAKTLGKDHPDYANSLNNLALLYDHMGNYSQAEALFIEAKNTWAKSLGKEHPLYATSLNNLATLYHATENYTQAERIGRESIAITEKTLGKKHPDYPSCLNNLALLYIDMRNYPLAEPLLIEANVRWAEILGKQHPLYASSLYGLADFYQHTQEYEKAEKFFLEALVLRANTLGKEHVNYGATLTNLGRLYIKMGKNTMALDYLHQAIKSYSGLDISMVITTAWADSLVNINYASNKHIDNLSNTLNHIYSLLNKTQNKEAQIIVSDLAHQLLKKSKDRFVNEQDKLRMLSQSHDWMLRSLSVLDLKKQKDKAFEIIETNKANLLLEAVKTEKAYLMGDLPDSLAQKETNLLKTYSSLEASLLEKRSEDEKNNLRSQLNELGQKINIFKKDIEKNYPKYAALKYQQKDVEISHIQNQLKENAALLEYVIGDSVVYIFYIDKKQALIIPQMIGTTELKNRVNEFYQALSSYELLTKNKSKSYQIFTTHAFWLYKNLLAPVLSTNKGINQLIIVSDGDLGHLPFETFLVEMAPQSVSEYKQLHYLVQDYKISYNYSATLFANAVTTEKSQNNGQLLGMAANYNLKPGSKRSSYSRLRSELNPLPAAQKEIEILAEQYNGFFAFDKMASEKVFKEKAGDYAIIHLAMHGLLDNKAPILSSLAFSEDGDSVENNFLHAYEISKMKLHAELVVLSACETGFGKFEKGNGIASLARAFVYAGVPSMIVSLWKVNDFATAELMKNFYKNLADGMDKDAALQEAKLKYLSNTQGVASHPAFWSPFILMGNTDAIQLKQKGNYWVWGIGIGVGILVLGAGWMIFGRKR